MSNNTIYNISFGQEGKDGKKHWQNCGILVIGEKDGEERISIKLNALPISTTFDGWLSVFPQKEDAPASSAQQSTKPKSAAQTVDDFDF